MSKVQMSAEQYNTLIDACFGVVGLLQNIHGEEYDEYDSLREILDDLSVEYIND